VRTSDGTDFVRAFAPVTTGNRVVAVTGLTNGVDYRVGVRGLNGRNGSAVTHSDTIRPLELAPFAAAEDFATQLLRDVNRSEPSTAAVQIIADSGRSRGVVSVTSETLGGNVGLRHRIMARLYLGFLDRIPDYGGLVFWMNDIAAQPSLTRVATRFARAAEFELGSALGNRDFVAEVYRTILDREPEPGGLGYWTERLDDGTPRGRALLEISESIEHRNSTEPGSMVIVTFATLLERLPTEEELANWRRRVANGEFVAMVTEIVGSPEYAERVSP